MKASQHGLAGESRGAEEEWLSGQKMSKEAGRKYELVLCRGS